VVLSALSPAAAAPPRAYRWPLDGAPEVVRPFQPPPRPWLAGHRGVDLAAEPGAVVRAAGRGVVRFAGAVAGTPVVSVDHERGLRTTYEPVRAAVTAGRAVAAGEPIGVLEAGHRGCPAEACLHWGLRRADRYLDPLALLGLGRVRLLPLSPGPPPAAREAGRRGARTPPPGCTPVRRGAGSRGAARRSRRPRCRASPR